MLYLNTYHIILCSHFNTPSSQEYKTVQRSLLLPEDSVVPLRPVAFVIYNHETRHYFTVVINYKLHHITPLSAIPSTHQPNCRPTGHDSNPTVSHPISLPTQLLADWSPIQHTLSADWSSLQPTVGHPISLPTQLSANWSPLQHTLSADWLSLQPRCWLSYQSTNLTVG